WLRVMDELPSHPLPGPTGEAASQGSGQLSPAAQPESPAEHRRSSQFPQMLDCKPCTVTDRCVEFGLGECRDPRPGEYRDAECPGVGVHHDSSLVPEVKEGSCLSVVLDRVHRKSGSDAMTKYLGFQQPTQGCRTFRSNKIAGMDEFEKFCHAASRTGIERRVSKIWSARSVEVVGGKAERLDFTAMGAFVNCT